MTPMNLHGKSQRLLPTLRMCALMAGLAVFVWGTGYKVSLYLNLGRAHGGIPPAKLLSPEQRSTNEVKVAISSAPANLVILFLPFLLLFLTGPTAGSLRLSAARLATKRSDLSGLKQSPELTYFAFRPPPFFISFSQSV